MSEGESLSIFLLGIIQEGSVVPRPPPSPPQKKGNVILATVSVPHSLP